MNYDYKLVAYIAERDYTLFSLIEIKMALPKTYKEKNSSGALPELGAAT